jgi:cytochrome b6-f complex iron-sulfur subunit
MVTALALLTALVVLAALAGWWIRRCNPAAVTSSPTARTMPGCDLGTQLLMASAAGGGGSPGTAGPGGVAKRRKPKGPSRRAFLRTSLGGGFLLTLGGFGGATLAYLWPDLRGGFGAEIEAGDHDQLLTEIQEEGPVTVPSARAYLVEFDSAEDTAGQYGDLVESGQIMALFWTCVHLGCKVPWCESSQWFECACHGSQYNRWGEYTGGPAPRGLDRFHTRVTDNGTLIVDTSEVIEGPSRASNQLDQPPQGPSCL